MAKRRSSARRRRRKRRSQSRSRLPAILFAALVATVAGYLVVRASDDTTTGNAPIIGTDTSGPAAEPDTNDGDSGEDSPPSDNAGDGNTTSATDPSNLGKPVPIFSDALGDLSIDQVIDDWTPVDRPKLPASTAAIDPKWVKSGRITVNLPDGYYWGVPVNTFDEDERGINFDIAQVFWGDACYAKFGVGDDTCLNDYQVVDTAGTQLYPSYLGDLLFVSFAVYGNTFSESNVAVVPPTFWSLLAAGESNAEETVMVTIPNGEPDPPSVPIANSPFLLTIVDGTIIAAEGIWIP
jgi:hypothetical protein